MTDEVEGLPLRTSLASASDDENIKAQLILFRQFETEETSLICYSWVYATMEADCKRGRAEVAHSTTSHSATAGRFHD